jgi:hypothetical protein
MIRGYQPVQPLEPEGHGRFQWAPALGAGLIASAILLVVPRGNPWAALTSFTPAIMGRPISPTTGFPLPAIWVAHLALAVIYGLIISRVIARLHGAAAILIGGLVGLLLYFANLGVVSILWPVRNGSELAVVSTHIVFGLIAAGVYRGLLRRKIPAAPSPQA